ncbi:hypothetical protein HDV05_005276 [Chytridiales sp. JEL 0842]|nr:hypothetical protein HDV05_005276 [Chytridiales sp. JEL 0842]
MCTRIKLDISYDNPKNNVFDFQEIIKRHLRGQPVQPLNSSSSLSVTGGGGDGDGGDLMNDGGHMGNESGDEGSQSENDKDSNDESDQQGPKPKRIDYTNTYDSEDDFIDDSELYYKEDAYVAPLVESNIGFFAWKGPIENFFEEYSTDIFETPKEKEPKKRRAASKKATDKPATKTTEAPVGGTPAGAVVVASGDKTENGVPLNGQQQNSPQPKIAAILDDGKGPVDGSAKKRKRTTNKTTDQADASSPSVKRVKHLDVQQQQSLPENQAAAGLVGSPTKTTANLGDVEMKPAPSLLSTPKKGSEQGEEIVIQETGGAPLTPAKKKKKKKDKLDPPGKERGKDLQGNDKDKVKQKEKDGEKEKEKGKEKEKSKDKVKVKSKEKDKEKEKEKEKEKDKDKKKKKVDPLPPSVEAKVRIFKDEAAKESFEEKKHFPPNLRPFLLEASKEAAAQSVLDENFIKHIRKTLPYNSFTIKKLVARMLIPDALVYLRSEMDKKYLEIEQKVKALCQQQEAVEVAEAAPPETTEEVKEPTDSKETSSTPAAADKKKFKWSDDLRQYVSTICNMESESAELFNQSYIINNENTRSSEQGVRKAVYAKLVSYWPQGTMTTLEISVQYSAYKRKIDRRSASGVKLEDSEARISTNVLMGLRAMFPDPLAKKDQKAAGGDGEKKSAAAGSGAVSASATPGGGGGSSVEGEQS